MAIAEDLPGIQSAVQAELDNPTGSRVFYADLTATLAGNAPFNPVTVDPEPDMSAMNMSGMMDVDGAPDLPGAMNQQMY